MDNPDNSGSEIGSDEHTITFPAPGTYEIRISGDFSRIHFDLQGDLGKILDIVQWGDIKWSTMEAAFKGVLNLTITAADTPDLSGVTSMRKMFRLAQFFNEDISDWDTGNVEDMSGMFSSELESPTGMIADYSGDMDLAMMGGIPSIRISKIGIPKASKI